MWISRLESGLVRENLTVDVKCNSDHRSRYLVFRCEKTVRALRPPPPRNQQNDEKILKHPTLWKLDQKAIAVFNSRVRRALGVSPGLLMGECRPKGILAIIGAMAGAKAFLLENAIENEKKAKEFGTGGFRVKGERRVRTLRAEAKICMERGQIDTYEEKLREIGEMEEQLKERSDFDQAHWVYCYRRGKASLSKGTDVDFDPEKMVRHFQNVARDRGEMKLRDDLLEGLIEKIPPESLGRLDSNFTL